MKKVVLTTLSIIAFIVSCKKSTEPEAIVENQNCSSGSSVERADYPISIGSYWIYDCYKVIDSSGVESLIRSSDTTRVIGDTVINGEIYSIFRGLKFPMASLVHDWYLRDSSTYIVDNYQGVTYGTWPCSDTINYFESNNYIQWSSCSGVDEQNSVDAGVFDTKRIRYHCMFTDGASISQCLSDSVSHNAGAEFYAKEVGLVQTNIGYSTQINCSHFEGRLIEYYIAP